MLYIDLPIQIKAWISKYYAKTANKNFAEKWRR